MSVIACSREDMRSVSIADRKEADEWGLSGGEEGVRDRGQLDPFEPVLGAEKRTMMLELRAGQSSGEILFCC